MNNWWSMKDINTANYNISKIKNDDNIVLFNKNGNVMNTKLYKFIDYFVILKWIFTLKYFLPNELIQKIIELKFNMELSTFKVFNKLDLHLSMIQKINHIDNIKYKSYTEIINIRIFGYVFFDESSFNSYSKKCNYPMFQDIAQKYAGMGHIEIISRVKENGLYFIRYDGGSNGYEVEYNHQQFMSLDLSKYQDKLMTFPELINYIVYVQENDLMDIWYRKKCIKF